MNYVDIEICSIFVIVSQNLVGVFLDNNVLEAALLAFTIKKSLHPTLTVFFMYEVEMLSIENASRYELKYSTFSRLSKERNKLIISNIDQK